MTAPSASYLKVAYDLRPAKQIERRMLIDTLQVLLAGGFPIREYQYTGMGSIYFFDFILFHKLLGIRRMVSAEYDLRIKRRVSFNKPFAEIDVVLGPIGDLLPRLDVDLKHLLWLDYDDRLHQTAVADTSFAAAVLPVGSIVLVTVDVEPPKGTATPAAWREYYEEQAGQYFTHGWSDENFALSQLASTNAQILFNAIGAGLAHRRNAHFYPLFNFVYADGHRMLTVGGMIVGDTERRRLEGCDFSNSPFLRFGETDSPFQILPPKLTKKERAILDFHMPSADRWVPREFELSREEVAAYRELYRYYPAYAELLI